MSATLDDEVSDLRRANAELQRRIEDALAERDDSEAQKAAIRDVLEVVNSSPGDLVPVFDAILEKAHTLCGAAHGLLLVRDGEKIRLVAVHGESRFAEGWLQLGAVSAVRPVEGGVVARLMRGEGFVHIADCMADESYRQAPAIRSLIETGRVRTALTVPLRKDGDLLGLIIAFRLEVRSFTDKQIALLQNFEAQVVIAMENARLITETREALEQQTAAAEVLQVMNSSPGDLEPVFDAILEKARQRTGAIHGDLWTDGECFHLVATHGEPGFSEWLRQQGPLRPRAGSGIERLLKGEDYVHLDDPLQDDGLRLAPEFLNQHRIAGIHTVLTVPLRKEGFVLGLISLYRR